MSVKVLIEAARPWHWIKNLIVLFPVVTSLSMDKPESWGLAAMAMAAFCLASSAIYILNDLRDRQADRSHPTKQHRPLASGRMSVSAAVAEALVLLAGATALAVATNWRVAGIVWAYVLLHLAYTFFLKRKAMMDVFCIALGFVFRAAGGALAIQVAISPYLFLCTFTICLFLGFCKRYNEVATLGDLGNARDHRITLAAYSRELLTHLMTLSGSVAVITFILYTCSPRVIEQFDTHLLVYTVPLVMYGIFRFAMLSMRGAYSDPTDVCLRDWPFQLTVVLWTAGMVAIITWGQALEEWMQGL